MSEGYEALRHGAAWLDLSARGRIVARGRDRARLLHNVTSNEVKKMTPGAGCYAFLLNPQGRIQADLYLLCFDDHFLIDTEPELREKVLQHILKYMIADQVELEDVTAATAAIGVEGPGSRGRAGALGAPVPGEYAAPALGRAHRGRRQPDRPAGLSHLLPPPAGCRSWPRCSSAPARSRHRRRCAPGAHRKRQAALRRRHPRDLVPQETQQMHAVSFTKGCYLGQEIVERIRAQGHVNKKLVRLDWTAGARRRPAPS